VPLNSRCVVSASLRERSLTRGDPEYFIVVKDTQKLRLSRSVAGTFSGASGTSGLNTLSPTLWTGEVSCHIFGEYSEPPTGRGRTKPDHEESVALAYSDSRAS
jgi:hypothetical protein